MGALSWQITDGSFGEIDLSTPRVVLVIWYSDDEPGSAGAGCCTSTSEAMPPRGALEDIFSGRRGGTPMSQFPWVFNPSNLLAVVTSAIEIDHARAEGRSARARR